MIRDGSLNTLELLPVTMEKGVFVTHLKWKIRPSFSDRHGQYFCSPELFLNDPLKNKPSKFQLRFTKQSKEKTGTLEYRKNNRWKFYSSIWHPEAKREFEFTVDLSNNFYYGSKTLDDDLRAYLASVHGETIAFGDETLPLQKCSKGVLQAFIGKEHNEDFVIECEGKEFNIKKIILRARSPVFDAMLSSNYFKEGRENRMVINDYDSEVVGKMVKFLQMDFAKNTSNCGYELYEIARKYMSQSFMEFTRFPFVDRLTMENFRILLAIVRKHRDKETEAVMKQWYSNQRRH